MYQEGFATYCERNGLEPTSAAARIEFNDHMRQFTHAWDQFEDLAADMGYFVGLVHQSECTTTGNKSVTA